METLLLEIHEMSREMNALIDTKMHVLEALLKRAEEAAERLESTTSAVEANTEKPVENSRYAEIYMLADEGNDAAEIARIKNMHQGEVELILNLRRHT